MRYLIVIIVAILTYSCVQQEKKLMGKTIVTFLPGTDSTELLCYTTYKTGFDNYEFDFYIHNKQKKDSIKLQNIYLNDANLTSFRFDYLIKGDKLIISSNYPIVIKEKSLLYKGWDIQWTH